jgi:F-type H+-transporting ATPase subunit a
MATPETHGAGAAHQASHSLFYGPVNSAWQWFLNLTGLDSRWGNVEVPEHVVGAVMVLLLVAVVFIPLRFRLKKERPGKLQQIFELFVQGLSSLIEDAAGHGAAKRHLPILGAFAVFIFLSNLSGLFYFLSPPTQSVNTTFALSLTAFLYYHYSGLRAQGLHYFKFVLGPVAWLFLLFIPLELISHSARALSLGLRLFGNIFGEHAISGAVNGLLPLFAPVPLMALGLFAAMLQTFIFVMLNTVYIAGAEHPDH